jgi:hypothetical protein
MKVNFDLTAYHMRKSEMDQIKPHELYYGCHEAYKSALQTFFGSLRHTTAITLSWNQLNISLERARSDIKELLWRVDKALLGSRANEYPTEERTSAVFVFEGLGRYEQLHAHSTWRAPFGKSLKLCKMFPREQSGIWDTIVRRGSHRLDLVSPNGSNDEFARYLLKGQKRSSDSFEIVFSSEFHPAR